MKKRKKRAVEISRTELDWGLKGLKISAFVLVVIILMCLFFLYAKNGDLSIVKSIILRKPGSDEFLIFFAGFILFIAAPFLIGVKVGVKLSSKKRR